MDTRFTSMDTGDGVFGGVVCARRAVTAAGALAAAVGGAFAVCLSGMRRPQFDEEHQRSLLSCHMPDELADGDSSFAGGNRSGPYKPQPGPGAGPEAAMLELRRRVMMGDPAPPSRWKQRKMLAKQHRKPLDKQDEHRRTSSTADATPAAESGDMAALLSDTTLAIDELLGSSSRPAGDMHAGGVRLEDVRRLSVDELLALTPTSTPETTGGNPETDAETDVEVISKDGARLRAWLAGIDSPRAGEYRAYAAMMERHGFQSPADLAQLDERDVETAMSEIGIAKFAHRLRIRKAIRELHLHLHAAPSPSPSVAPTPAAVAAA